MGSPFIHPPKLLDLVDSKEDNMESHLASQFTLFMSDFAKTLPLHTEQPMSEDCLRLDNSLNIGNIKNEVASIHISRRCRKFGELVDDKIYERLNNLHPFGRVAYNDLQLKFVEWWLYKITELKFLRTAKHSKVGPYEHRFVVMPKSLLDSEFCFDEKVFDFGSGKFQIQDIASATGAPTFFSDKIEDVFIGRYDLEFGSLHVRVNTTGGPVHKYNRRHKTYNLSMCAEVAKPTNIYRIKVYKPNRL